MTSAVVVDTDLVIDYLRGAEPGRTALEGWLRAGRLRLAAVTAFELRLGTGYLRQERDITALLVGRVLNFDLPTALIAGTVAAELRRRGREIGHADSMVAGTCLRHQLPLATRNLAHFSRVPGLVLAELT